MPELCEVAAAVRESKILAQTDSEHGGDANTDVAVTAEIQIDLHGKAKKSHQALEARISIWHGEYPVIILGNVIGNNGFLDNAKDDEPESQIKETLADCVFPSYLREESFCPSDRAGQQEREEGEIEKVFQKGNFEAEVTPIDIHRIADGLERIEGNADGECNTRQRKIGGEHLTEQFRKRVPVLEEEER